MPPAKVTDIGTRQEVAEIRASASILLERIQFMRQAGITFDGARDLYEILGYDRLITNLQYRDRYARGGIAKRIVEAFPKACWRGGGTISEDEDPTPTTQFEEFWAKEDIRLNIWSTFMRADILAGLSTFSVILLGAAGKLSDPLPTGQPGKLLYLAPFCGGGGPMFGTNRAQQATLDSDVTIMEYDTRTDSPRFGLPLTYQLRRTNMSVDFGPTVHWTRIIHIAEGCLDDEVFGQPTLENVWNLLDDLEKVTGGGAEAFWLRANQGLHINFDKDMKNITPEQKEQLTENLEKYKHGLDRWIRTRGTEVNTLGSDVANFSGPADSIITQIAGAKGIPKRILTGSEQGQLASSQDRDNWKDQVNGRQETYAGPFMVRKLVNRLIEYNYLPPPAAGPNAYFVKWPHIEVLTEDEKASGAQKWAQVNATMGMTVFTDSEIRKHWYGMSENEADAATEKYKADGALKWAETNKTQGATIFTDEEIRKVWYGYKPLTDAEKVPITAPERVSSTAPTPPEDARPGQPAIPGKPVAVPGAPAAKPAFPPAVVKAAAESGWAVTPSGLQKTFTFDNRRDLASFLQAVMMDANTANHHPDIETTGDSTTITFCTHQQDDEITDLDYQSADRVDRLGVTYRAAIAAERKYASTQIALAPEHATSLLELGQSIPEEDLADGDPGSAGRETDPHITVKYGLHSDDPQPVQDVVGDFGPVSYELGPTDYFSTPNYDVLYVDVMSDDLTRLNDLVSRTQPVTDTHPVYSPHATVAYLKPGLGPKYADRTDLAGKTGTTTSLLHSATDGTKTDVSLRDPAANLLQMLQTAVESNDLAVLDRLLGVKHV